MTSGLNLYDINVVNGTTTAKLASSYTKLGSSSNIDAVGLSFLDDIGNSVLPQSYGLSGDSQDAVAHEIAKLMPPENSYVKPDFNLPDQFIFGNSTAYLNLVQGLYRHSENLQNWTTNLAQVLTNNLAVVAPAPATSEYDGVAQQLRTYFKIRWCKCRSA